MINFLKSLFRGSQRPENLTQQPLPSVEQMSFEQILAHIVSLDGAMPIGLATSLVRRLYEIALYDHHVPIEQRKNAYQLLEGVKADLETTLAENPGALEAFRNANKHMEGNVRYIGVDSLAWTIKENNISDNQIVSFVMRPEHGHLLADFLVTLEPSVVESVKTQLIRELILSRRYDNTYNAVLILHGLAAKADSATVALFTPEELTALLGVPDDYKAGRNVLVNLELLPAVSNARQFDPALDKELLLSVMVQVWKERDAAAKSNPRLNGLSEDRSTMVLLALSLLCSHLTRRVLRQIYGSEISSAFLSIHKLESLKQTLERFDQVVDKLTGVTPVAPIDLMLFLEIMELGGIAVETEETYEREKEWIEMCAEWLNHERVGLLDYLRFILRWFADESPLAIRSVADEEIAGFIREIYMRKGAQAGIAEKTMVYFEDWIGTDA